MSGESATIFEDYFLVMPEPYLAARQQGLAWVAEYLDQAWLQDPGGGPTFDTREGPLLLSSLPYLHHGDTVSVVIRRTDKVRRHILSFHNNIYCSVGALPGEISW